MVCARRYGILLVAVYRLDQLPSPRSKVDTVRFRRFTLAHHWRCCRRSMLVQHLRTCSLLPKFFARQSRRFCHPMRLQRSTERLAFTIWPNEGGASLRALCTHSSFVLGL